MNLDAERESDLRKISADTLRGVLGDRLSFARLGEPGDPLGEAGIRTPIWGQLFAALLLLLIAESALARKA